MGGIYPNLLVAHPPFQIDGNLGFTAAMAECILQSHGETIDILPALPPELLNGIARRLVARPGVEVTVSWGEGALERVELTARTALAAGLRKLRYAGREVDVHLEVGKKTVIANSMFD